MGDEELIVVGVDGSTGGRSALVFALEEAARRRARVRAVIAVQPPQYWAVAYGMAAGMIVPPSTAELVEAATHTLRDVVDEVTAEVGTAGTVAVERRVVLGAPGRVLLDEAADADLLVVGHRGLGSFASACLGSVGLHCVLHATCPVTVVRPVPSRPDREPAAALAGQGR